jgi:hypothetical protein
VDEPEALVLGEVGVVLDVERGEGSSRTRRPAAIHESFADRGRRRSWAYGLDLAQRLEWTAR